MAITYPISFPSVTGVAKIELFAKTATAISRSPFSFQSQVQSYTGQLWAASVSLPPMQREDAEHWIGFLLKLKGSFGTFLMGDPNGATPRGTARDTDAFYTSAVETGGDVTLKSDTLLSTNNALRRGDYFQIGTGADARLYKVLNALDTDGTGADNVDIWPDLRTATVALDPVVLEGAVGRWRLSGNETGWTVDSARLYGISFQCEEAL